jgi:flagellar biosynthesis protein FliR
MMIAIAPGQLEGWMVQYFWPFVRIGAFLMVAPIIGATFVPPRFRLVLAGAITLLVAPLVTLPQGIEPLSVAGVIVTTHQLLIGAATGFVLQVIFDSLAMGGQLLANSMGLSFAFNVDPQHGASTPVVGYMYMLMVTLTFLALNGHLAMIEALVDGFRTLPIGMTGFGADQWWQIVGWGNQLFAGALTVALPGMTALLVVNLGFGVMSRAAPSLNMFAVGFPITLVFGLLVILLGLPAVQSSFTTLIGECLVLVRTLAGGA